MERRERVARWLHEHHRKHRMTGTIPLWESATEAERARCWTGADELLSLLDGVSENGPVSHVGNESDSGNPEPVGEIICHDDPMYARPLDPDGRWAKFYDDPPPVGSHLYAHPPERNQLLRDHEAMERLRQEANEGGCPCLVFDDSGHWALSDSGMQPAKEKPEFIEVWTDRSIWCDDPADAILAEKEEGEGDD